jgi:hypothetical protein
MIALAAFLIVAPILGASLYFVDRAYGGRVRALLIKALVGDVLLKVVDLTWGRAYEDKSVPSFQIADEIIEEALRDIATLLRSSGLWPCRPDRA